MPKPNAVLRAFCFPYAGGSSGSFLSLANSISDSIELIAVQLPGRANRMAEQPINNMADMVETITSYSHYITEKPYVMLGHSMGARIVYAAALAFTEAKLPLPVHMIVSGSRAAYLPTSDEVFYDWPKPQFLSKLKSLNGTPDEVLEHDDLLDILLPMLRADFELAQCYQSEIHQIDCPITALGGLSDASVSHLQLNAWAELTTKSFECKMLQGDHFFIDKNKPDFTKAINEIFKSII